MNVQDPECGGWDGEEIHRDQVVDVVSQESLPALARAPRSGAILANGRIGHFNAQFGQFALDAPAAPGRIGLPHVPNEVDQVSVDSRSTTPGPRLPPPKGSEERPMPTNDVFRTNDDQHLSPVRPVSLDTDPQAAVARMEVGPLLVSLEHLDLMSQGQILEQKPLPAPADGQQGFEQ